MKQREKDYVEVYRESSSVEEALREELEKRIHELDETGPGGPKQAMPYITVQQLIPIIIMVLIFVAMHVWALVTVLS